MRNKNIFFKSGITFIISLLFFVSLSGQEDSHRSSWKKGVWRGALQLNDSTELTFNFEVKESLLEIINGEERIVVDEIQFIGHDSVIIKMPVFDSEFRVQLTKVFLSLPNTSTWMATGNVILAQKLKIRAKQKECLFKRILSKNLREPF